MFRAFSVNRVDTRFVGPDHRLADDTSLQRDELMAALRDPVGRARASALCSSELTAATITVTSLGDEADYPLLATRDGAAAYLCR